MSTAGAQRRTLMPQLVLVARDAGGLLTMVPPCRDQET